MAAPFGRPTPTKSFVLPYKKTLGNGAIAIYEETGRKAMEWQKMLLRDIMAINDDGLWTHMTVGYSVPRRNGKTEAIYMRVQYGLEIGERIIYTSHRTSTSHSAFNSIKGLLESRGLEEKKDFRSIKAKGAEEIEMLETGGKIDFRTRTGSGGLGEGFDLLIIDEAQEYTDDQQSALEYTTTSSRNPQTIMCGTPPTAVSKGTIFPPYRNSCLAGKEEDSMWAEWSIDHMAKDRADEKLWYETNPSLGYTLNVRSVKKELKTEETDFNIQRLGLWITYNQASAISQAEWDSCMIDKSSLPGFTGGLYAGIKYGKDNRNVSLSIALKTATGAIFVECLDCRPITAGNQWIAQWLDCLKPEAIVIDGANGQALLAKELRDYGIKKKPLLPTVNQIIEANSAFYLAIQAKEVCHAGQPSLVQSVCNCDRRAIGSNGGFGFKSQFEDIDVSLMESAILAHWACKEAKTKAKQRVSY